MTFLPVLVWGEQDWGEAVWGGTPNAAGFVVVTTAPTFTHTVISTGPTITFVIGAS